MKLAGSCGVLIRRKFSLCHGISCSVKSTVIIGCGLVLVLTGLLNTDATFALEMSNWDWMQVATLGPDADKTDSRQSWPRVWLFNL